MVKKTLRKGYLDIGIRPAPDQRQPSRPILPINHLARVGMFFLGQDSGQSLEFRARDFSADRTRSDTHARIIPDAFGFAHVAARHHVQLVAIFPKPYWS